MLRKIESDLVQWKQQKNHKPLILSGARQVGKTYSILQFAKKEYDSFIYINFERDLDIKKVFSETANPTEILMFLEARFADVAFKENNLLIIMDEIQACPLALTSIKFLGSETSYDYILSGSLLGIAINHTSSYPVGYVESMEMVPMQFDEFLYANGVKESQILYIKECFQSGKLVMEGIHKIFMDLFKAYLICGVMPEAVQTYCDTKNYAMVQKVQRQIIDDYYRDMAKYAEPSDKIKTHDCFASIPEQLAKENKKFQYKLVRSGGNAAYFESSLQWLLDAGTIQKCYRLKTIAEPLKAYKETSIFKVYMADTGLLISMFDHDTISKLLVNELGIYKGAIYENITAQILTANQHDLYYFEPSSHSEIDFILHTSKENIPIEVKSSTNTKARSLKSYVEKYKPDIAYRFSMNNVNTEHEIIKDYPLYMMMFI